MNKIDLAKAPNNGYIKARFHEKAAGFDFACTEVSRASRLPLH
jgi:hypothetical protein